MPDFGLQKLNVITVTLLAEAAEAVLLLPYLACGKPHALGQLAGGNPCHSRRLKLA